MRHCTILLFAAALAVSPAAAQQAQNDVATNDVAAPDMNMTGNAADPMMNGTAPAVTDPTLVVDPALPPVAEAPGVTDAVVTPEPRRGGGAFPWGLLGLVGLVGLIGRFRS